MGTDDAKTRLLEAAGPIFAEKGFQGASVREICDAASVNLAAINYYFGSKEALYFAVFRIAHPLMREEDDPFSTVGDLKDMRSEDKLRLIIHRVVSHMLGVDRASWQGRFLIREMLDPTPACLELLRELLQQRAKGIQSLLRELLPADTPEDRIIKMAFSVIGQCIHYRIGDKIMEMLIPAEMKTEYFTPEQIADHIADVCLAAVGRGPSLAEIINDDYETTK